MSLYSPSGVNKKFIRKKLGCNSANDFFNLMMSDVDKAAEALAAQYRRRHKAKVLAKSQYHDTGEVDPKNLWKYRVSDEIFSIDEILPRGKSNGIFMMMDWSGSMCSVFLPMLKKALITVKFAKKVGIRCDVCFFSNKRKHIFGYKWQEFVPQMTEEETYHPSKRLSRETENHSLEIDFDDVQIVKIFTNKMKNKDLMKTAFVMYRIAGTHNAKAMRFLWNKHVVFGDEETKKDLPRDSKRVEAIIKYMLGGTPLNEGLSLSKKLLEDEYLGRYQNINFILISDGMGHRFNFNTRNKNDHILSSTIDRQLKLINTKTNTQYDVQNTEYSKSWDISMAYLNEIKKMGIRTTCFFITNRNHKVLSDNNRSPLEPFFESKYALNKTIRKLGLVDKNDEPVKRDFYSTENLLGVDKFFLLTKNLFNIPGSNASLDEIDAENATVNKLAKVLTNSQSQRKKYRLLAQEIIDHIV